MAMTPEQIAALRDATQKVSGPINDWLLKDAAERIAKAGEMTSTAAYNLYRANALGKSKKELKEFLKKQLDLSNSQINRLFRQAAKWSCGNDFDRLSLGVHSWVSGEYEQMISAAVKLAQSDFTNLTQTLGMVGPSGNAMPLQQFYRESMDFAFEQVFTGAADYETAIRMATTKMATSGVGVIDYESGVHTSLEAATRRNMMGAMGLMDEQITRKNHDDLGCDGWEISAHGGSAPDHEPYQGRQYSDKDYQKLNNSLQRRIGTLNCGHEAFPIILGVNEPQYTEAELEELKRKNAEGITYQGRHYTLYEATQKQRQIEKAQRVQKNRILVADVTGDIQRKQTAQIRLNALQGEYRAFSKAAGLRTQAERANVAGFSWKDANEAAKTFDKYSKIRYHKDGTIVVTNDWKDRGKVTIPKKYLPNAVVETKTVYKNGKVQIDRTIYGEDAMMKTQIHSGDHNRPDQHKYGKNGEHAHDYRWADGVLQERISRNLTDAEQEQHADVLRKEQEGSE